MPQLGVPELVLILVIVIAVFGAGKLANLGGALGKGVRDFRTSLKDEESDKNSEIAEATKAVANGPAPQAVSAPRAASETVAAPEAATGETEPSA